MFKYLIFIAICVYGIPAQQTGIGRCPKVDVQKNFDLNALISSDYIHIISKMAVLDTNTTSSTTCGDAPRSLFLLIADLCDLQKFSLVEVREAEGLRRSFQSIRL
ncbi:hypothetical protein WA026_003043 [Henosepilachna vigintioctopunctata]|uniref:Uncharacterized protein n=1 Tax=Henosepilachna vigintioctopunctata TaxID=420089 RepID=A0AAW1TIF0_9CUCU